MDLKKQLQQWHEDDEHVRIIEAIKAIPERERDYELVGMLGRALNNNDQYEEAIEVLMSVEKQGREDGLWNFRMGYAYFYMPCSTRKERIGNLEIALTYFTEAEQRGDDQAAMFCGWCSEELAQLRIPPAVRGQRAVRRAQSARYNQSGGYKA